MFLKWEDNFIYYLKTMFTITKEFKWDMAHRLPNHEWKCFNVHWHTYKALITFRGVKVHEDWAEEWMVKDFWNLKPVKEWIDENRDHAYVWKKWDEVLEFLKEKGYKTFEFDVSPTAELMSKYLFETIAKDIMWIEAVTVYETPTSYATYTYTSDLPF